MSSDPRDVLAIMAVQNRYAWALDTREFEGLRAVFCDDVVADYRVFTAHGLDELIEIMVGSHAGVRATQHVVGGHDITVDGDRAHARCQVLATLRGGAGDLYRTGGWYADDLVRTAAGWRIARRLAHGLWAEGDRDAVAPPRRPDGSVPGSAP